MARTKKKEHTLDDVRAEFLAWVEKSMPVMKKEPRGLRVLNECASAMKYGVPSVDFQTSLNKVFGSENKKKKTKGVVFKDVSPSFAKKNITEYAKNLGKCTNCEEAKYGVFAQGVADGYIATEIAEADSVDDIINYFLNNNLPAPIRLDKAKAVIDYMKDNMKAETAYTETDTIQSLCQKIWDAAYANAF